jgi:signal transduction histidine kinase
MFEPFKSRLGLAIAKQILTLHHATVRAVNRDAGGLEVWIMLPTDDVS